MSSNFTSLKMIRVLIEAKVQTLLGQGSVTMSRTRIETSKNYNSHHFETSEIRTRIILRQVKLDLASF